MQKIKIVNIISRLVYGGTETVVYNYYKNIDKDKFELYIICMNESNEKAIKRFERIGFKVITVGNWEKKPVAEGKRIFKILKDYKFDIVHAHLSHTSFYFMILAKLAKIKHRITHSHLTKKDENLKVNIRHCIYKILIKLFSTNYMACSEAAAVDLFGKIKDVYILRNAIEVNEFKYNESYREKYRKNLNIAKDEIVYGSVGRFTPQKNQLFLIDIFYEISLLDEKSKLLLIGDGELKKDIIVKAKQLNISDKIIILSNREDINFFYQAMDRFILPSLYEGLGIVLIEAQVSGLQCFTSDIVVPKEAKVTDCCEYISLDKNSKEWAGLILNHEYKERRSYDEEVSKQGYNITLESERLSDYYEKIM